MSAQIEELIEASKACRERKDTGGIEFAKQAYSLAIEQQDLRLRIAALRERANFAMYVTADYEEADKACREMLQLVQLPNDAVIAGVAYNMQGVINDVKGKYTESRNFYLKTIELLEMQWNLNHEGQVVLGNAYYNLAKLYTQIDVADERVVYVEKALQVFEKANDSAGLARVWNLKASMLPESAPIEERLAIFEKAFEYFKNGDDKPGYAITLGNIGLCYCRLKNFEKGISTLELSLEKVRLTNNPPLIGFNLFQLGEAYRLKGDNETSIEYLRQAEETMVSANAKVYLSVIYNEWANNLAALGNYREAYVKMLKYVAHIADRLEFGRQSAVAEAQLRFELEKKEKESELLKKKNEEIEIYNQKLEHTNSELNQFAYVASHDLKEPVRMVSNYIQLLEKSLGSNLNEDQATYMRYAVDGAKRMYKMIDSLLVFSRATLETELKPVDLNAVLDEVRLILFSDSNLKLKLTANELPVIKGNYDQMLQVFQNLITNATKYNDKEVAEVNIRYVPGESEHVLYFEDNGIGILEEHREKVFELFQRLHHRESYSGTGIGLSICKKIINRLNGQIWIEDSPLGGASFVFSIPKRAPKRKS
jgi:signal transduction histidine kinase